MLDKFKRIAQVPPAAPMDPMMGAMPPAAPGMPAMGMPAPMGTQVMPGMPGMPPPVQPMSSPPDRMEITKGLDSLGEIMYDADMTEMIENNVGMSAEDLSTKLWMAYGGNEDGTIDENKVGARSKQPLQGEEADKEREATEDKRWLRLIKSATIGDLTSLESIIKVMPATIFNAIQASKAGAAPPGGGMGGLPMASSKGKFVRLAKTFFNRVRWQTLETGHIMSDPCYINDNMSVTFTIVPTFGEAFDLYIDTRPDAWTTGDPGELLGSQFNTIFTAKLYAAFELQKIKKDPSLYGMSNESINWKPESEEPTPEQPKEDVYKHEPLSKKTKKDQLNSLGYHANLLDSLGYHREADKIDKFLFVKYANKKNHM